MRPPWMALALLLVVAAPAGAQVQTTLVQSTTGVLLSDLGGPVFPGDSVNMTVTVTYRHGLGGQGTGPTQVTVEAAEVPPWANFTLDRSEVTFETDPTTPQPPEQRATVNAVLALSPEAPAFQRGNLTIVARAADNGNVRGSQGQSQIFVVPAFNGTLWIDAPPAIRMRGGLPYDVHFTVTNLGNAVATVDLALPSVPESTLATMPEDMVLKPRESASRTITLRGGWVETGSGILTIQATPGVEGKSTEVEPTLHDVLVTTLAAVPGPGAVVAAAAVAGLAFARRRSR